MKRIKKLKLLLQHIKYTNKEIQKHSNTCKQCQPIIKCNKYNSLQSDLTLYCSHFLKHLLKYLS